MEKEIQSEQWMAETMTINSGLGERAPSPVNCLPWGPAGHCHAGSVLGWT